MSDNNNTDTRALQTLLTALADDEFILGYRNSEWTGIAPMLEEDVAFSSMSQDEIGHARIMYQMLSELTGVSADRIAYARRPEEFLNCQLVEHRRLDWAHAIARYFLYDTADHVRVEALTRSQYAPLANAMQKIVREEKYHLMHGDIWIKRLASFSPESRERLIAALDSLWPDALGMFEPLPGEEELVASGVLEAPMSELQAEWLEQVAPYFESLDLPFPAKKDESTGRYVPTVQPVYGGRQGQHTAELAELWEEMTSVYRLDPEAVW
ncbi:MAG: phenylacetate-CoA oxygenase subunit PaaC [Chloroflexota bacterium]|nr:phenylacetate-CoA oxygenase subunit PaaC [Chloroflexota bacterium]